MKDTQPVFSLTDQAQCLHRGIRMRYAVYPGKVAQRKPGFTQADMDREIGLMQAAADTVEKMVKNGQFRQLYEAVGAAGQLAMPELASQIALVLSQTN